MFKVENFFNTTLLNTIAADNNDGTIALAQAPKGDSGYVIIDYGLAAQEIIPYHSRSGATLNYYGARRTSPQAHNPNATVAIHVFAEHINTIITNTDNGFNIKEKGGLEITVTGGLSYLDNTRSIISNTDFTLIDDTTNYIYVTYGASTLQTTTSISVAQNNFTVAEIVTTSGVITSINKPLPLAGSTTTYNSTQFAQVNGQLKVKAGGIGTTELADGAVTAVKAATEFTLKGNVFNTADQLVELLSDGKLPILDGSNLTNLPTGSIPDGSVTTAKLANGAVTLDKLADNAVDTVKLNSGAVTNAKIEDNAVSQEKIDFVAVEGDTTVETITSLTQAEYDAIPVKEATRIYIITDA